LEADPEHLEAKNNLSICQVKLNDSDGAVRGFEGISSELFEAQFNLAVLLMEAGDFQEMCPVVEAVVKRGKDLGHSESELLGEWFKKISC
jgi:hypothetical protein